MDGGFRDDLIALLPRLRRFARGLCGSSAEADDLVQAACERALSRAHQWTPGTRLDSWLYRMIQTIHIDRRRADGVWNTYRTTAAALGPAAADGARAAESRVALSQVSRRLDRLPDDQRAVLLLVCVEGLSYREAADALDLPLGTVMSRLYRARAALTERPDDSLEESP